MQITSSSALALRHQHQLSWSLTPGSRLHRVLLSLGMAAPMVFALAYTVEGATRPGYNPLLQTISGLSLGPQGWLQMLNFVVFGLLTVASAPAWRLSLASGRGARVLPALKVGMGVGLIIAGLCVTDATGVHVASFHGALHNIASYLTLIATWCSMFVFAARFAVEPGWRGWSVFAALSGLLMIVLLGSMGMAIAQHGDVGLFERLATLATMPLSVVVAVRLLAGECRVSRAR